MGKSGCSELLVRDPLKSLVKRATLCSKHICFHSKLSGPGTAGSFSLLGFQGPAEGQSSHSDFSTLCRMDDDSV